MALLQISEPGQSTAPHEHRLAVGIDLGTTNSLVASVRSSLADTCRTKPAGICCPRSCTTDAVPIPWLVMQRSIWLRMIR